MISTEKAFDMLPYAIDIIDKLDVKGYGSNVARELQKQEMAIEDLQMEVATEVLLYVAKNLPKVKGEFFQLVAITSDVDVETAKSRPLAESIQILKDVFLDKELLDFFKAAVQ